MFSISRLSISFNLVAIVDYMSSKMQRDKRIDTWFTQVLFLTIYNYVSTATT